MPPAAEARVAFLLDLQFGQMYFMFELFEIPMKQFIKSTVFALGAAAACAASAAEIEGDIYLMNLVGGNDSQQYLDNPLMYGYYKDGVLTAIGSGDTVKWESANVFLDSKTHLEGQNVVRPPHGSNLTVANLTVANWNNVDGKSNQQHFWPLGNSDANFDLNVSGTFKVSNTSWWGNDIRAMGVSAGNVVIENTDYAKYGTLDVNWGTGDASVGGLHQWKGFKYLDVKDDMTISGGILFRTSIGDVTASSSFSAESPNIKIGGVLNMDSNAQGTPEWKIYFFEGVDGKVDVPCYSYITLGGLSGSGSIKNVTQHAHSNTEPHSVFTFTNAAGSVSEFSGSLTSESMSVIDINMEGSGTQILRLKDVNNQGLKGDITVKNGTLKMSLDMVVADGSFGGKRNLYLRGGNFGAAAADKPGEGMADIGIARVDDFTWESGKLIVASDGSSNSSLIIGGSLDFAGGDGGKYVFAVEGGAAEGDMLEDIMKWDSGNDAANKAALESAIADEKLVLTVNGVEHNVSWIVDNFGLSAAIGAAIPEASDFAAAIGAVALAFAAARRRK